MNDLQSLAALEGEVNRRPFLAALEGEVNCRPFLAALEVGVNRRSFLVALEVGVNCCLLPLVYSVSPSFGGVRGGF